MVDDLKEMEQKYLDVELNIGFLSYFLNFLQCSQNIFPFKTSQMESPESVSLKPRNTLALIRISLKQFSVYRSMQYANWSLSNSSKKIFWLKTHIFTWSFSTLVLIFQYVHVPFYFSPLTASTNCVKQWELVNYFPFMAVGFIPILVTQAQGRYIWPKRGRLLKVFY